MPTTYIVPKNITALNVAPASTAVAGDTVIFAEGSQTIDTALSQWAFATGLANLYFQPGSALTVGTASTTSLKLDVTALLKYAASGGVLNLEAAGVTAATIARLQQIGGGLLNITGGTITRMEVASGTTRVNDTTVVPFYFQSGGQANFRQIAITSGFQQCYVTGGQLITERGLDSDYSTGIGSLMQINGGSVVVGLIDSLASGGNIPVGTSAGSQGGTIEVNGRNSSLVWRGGNIGTLRVTGGASVDLGNTPVPITVTNLYIDGPSLARSTIINSKTGANTVTNKFFYGCASDQLIA